MRFDLQFFGEGEEAPEVAEPVVTDNQAESSDSIGENENGVADHSIDNESNDDVNAQFAAARRKAEESYRKKFEAEKERVNQRFQRMFPDVTNPETGKPITSMDEYLDSVEAFRNREMNDRLKNAGINPDIINQLVNNNPAVINANRIMEQQKQAEAERALMEDLKSVSQIDSDIKTMDDLTKHESYSDVVKYVNQGLGLVDAFKLANYSRLSSRATDAAKQAAINQAKGQSHFTVTNSVSAPSSTNVPIPNEVLSKWKDAYPNLTLEQLTEKYNKVI